MPKTLGVLLKEALTNLFKRPVTVLYPAEYRKPPERFRGRLVWNDDRCIRCNMCVRDCPGEVLHFAVRQPEQPDKRHRPVEDLVAIMERCIYCGQCSWVCPRDAIRFERVQEMAETHRQQFKYFIEKGDPDNGTARVVMTISSANSEQAVEHGRLHRTDIEQTEDQQPGNGPQSQD